MAAGPEWQTYRDSLPDHYHRHYDVQHACEELEADSSRIFSGKKGSIEVWTRKNGTAVKSELDTRNSWSPLEADLSDLRSILTTHRVSPRFLEAIHAFGGKATGDDDAYFNICETQTSGEEPNRISDPWSLRQMALYHRHESQTSRSVWILIQPFLRAKYVFMKAFGAADSDGVAAPPERPPPLPQQPQQQLAEAQSEPRSSLERKKTSQDHRRKMVSHFTEKAIHSNGDVKKPYDYDTGFSDCQKLQKLVTSLALAQHILGATQNVRIMLSKLHVPVHADAGRPKSDSNTNTIRAQINGFTRTAASLEKSAEGTSRLMSKLLEYRKSDQLNAQAGLLASLTAQANAQSHELRSLAYESRTDSRYTKILGFVATIYLPASLLALPQLITSDPSGTGGSRILYISQAMWLFVLMPRKQFSR
ncbi:hypothetical protein QBC37DRAFT_478257 [Rhypophila decipiens]|uniref:CorA-like transporter domain-containing protein n=1 Tax=Rhypophila decipiens TaxID=261697 RepID=A0AAN6YIX6_9PEZI|nr:hypothetical protein QBC37DRAFT_478257 [Rhypophila decipiens]